MTFDALETGIATGKPLRGYLFERFGSGLPLRWAYNSSGVDVAYGGVTFRGLVISDDGMRQTGAASADALKIKAPASIEVVQPWRGVAPSAEIHVTLFDLHHGDLVGRVRWIGSISGVNWPSRNECQITCQSLRASMEQSGLRETWSRGCQKTLYQCGVNAALWRTPRTLTAVNTTSVVVDSLDGFPADFFVGGFIEWDVAAGIPERRGIETQSGTTLGLLDLTTGLSVGQAVAIYPGCDRRLATCNSKFNNLLNYGGSPYMPGDSPMSGDPIF